MPNAKVTERDFEWTRDKIVEAATTWANFNGFTAEICFHCKKTANVLAGGSGWFCVCGVYNCEAWDNNQIPHEDPDLGPTGALIHEAIALARTKRLV